VIISRADEEDKQMSYGGQGNRELEVFFHTRSKSIIK
jgi:hypothetical protein